MPKVAKSRVVVTGSRSGIGAAIARRLAADSWQVIGIDLAHDPDADYLYEQRIADLSDFESVEALAKDMRGVQALVHAAGFMRTGALDALDPSDGDAMWRVHVRALAELARHMAPAMSAGGRILAIGSRTSAGAASKSQYAASKAAVTGLIRSWAIELAPRGITANVIAPAATATPLLSDPNRSVGPERPPIGRFIEPSEVAAYAAFVLSREADAITGQELLICGGASL